MGRRTLPLTVEHLADLPGPSRCCALWELQHRQDTQPVVPATDAWVHDILRDWGSCGRIVYVDGQAAGFVLFAPPEYVEDAQPVATSPVSDDAVLLMAARVLPEFAGGGLSKVLLQAAAADLVRLGNVGAVETFADMQGEEGHCVLPARFLTSVGFTTVHPHLRYPQLRMDLHTTVTWRDGVEEALERLLAAWSARRRQHPTTPRPAGAGRVSR